MQTIQFGLYFFVFLLTESIVNEQAAILFNAMPVNYIYAVGLLFTAIGYLLYGLTGKKLRRENIYVLLGIIALTEIGISIAIIPTLFLFVSYSCLLSLGYLGGYLHNVIGLRLKNKHFSLNIGIVCALGVILQFIDQNIAEINYVCTLIIIECVIVAICIIAMKTAICSVIDSSECQDTIPTARVDINTRVGIYIVAVIIMSAILGIQDSIVVWKNATGELELFSAVRLFYALGLLIAGMIADIKNRIYLSLATVSAMVLSVLAISFIGNEAVYYNISMAIMYFYSGFYVMFLTVMFMELGARRHSMVFYAGFGRVIRSVTTSLIVFATVLLGDRIGVLAYITISCILCVVLIISMSLAGILLPEKIIVQEVAVDRKEKSFEDRINDVYEMYNFTSKEREAYEWLVTTEMGVQEIADTMSISRRVLQRHIASIYEKTGTKTRVGLLMLINK